MMVVPDRTGARTSLSAWLAGWQPAISRFRIGSSLRYGIAASSGDAPFSVRMVVPVRVVSGLATRDIPIPNREQSALRSHG